MSLTKLLKAPIKLFRKEVITFLTIRRYDLGLVYENLRYISVRPSASISVLRQKIWHLLDLPDYCEEIIILKTTSDVEVPLTDLRKGNDPYRPFILEVYKPGKHVSASSIEPHNMLMNTINSKNFTITSTVIPEKNKSPDNRIEYGFNSPTISSETAEDKMTVGTINNLLTHAKNSEVTCHQSNSSIFRVNGKKSRENFANILIKIQSDICKLTSKLDLLEGRLN